MNTTITATARPAIERVLNFLLRCIKHLMVLSALDPTMPQGSADQDSWNTAKALSTDDQVQSSASRISELYRRHSSWLVASVRRRGAGDAAEDVVQEAFIRVARYAETVELRHPKALLLKIALNVVREAARRGAAVKHRPPVFDGTIDEAIGAEQFELVLLKQTVMALPETYRDVFLLNRFGGMSYQEIAEACGVSIKTVEWRMSRALAMCAARMRD